MVFDNLVYGHEWAVKWGPLVEGDLADGALIKRVLEEHEVTAVVHFAAYAYVGESVTNPRKYFRNNVAGTLNLLDAMLDAGVRDIVFSSTCATYGEPQQRADRRGPSAEPGQPVRRDQADRRADAALVRAGLRPALRGAALLQRRRRRSRRRARRGPRSGDAPHPAGDRGGAGRQGALEIFGTDYATPDGTAIRDYIHVQDLADAHVAALDKLRAGATSLSVNLGTGRGHSVREVIAAVEKVSGKKVPVREAGRRAGDPPALVADAAARRRSPGLEGAHSQHRDHRRARLALDGRSAQTEPRT